MTLAGTVNASARDERSLGTRLQGVQHFGVTVQNMDRAFAFYSEVLGGTEVMRDGDFHGEPIHNTLLTEEEIEARVRQANPRTLGIPDLRDGAQRLDVRFIQFDNAVIELLQYRDADQPSGSGASFAEPHDRMSPAYPRSMHICFHIRDDVDFRAFIRDLEAEASRRGMTQVKANRVITVTTEQQRLSAPISSYANSITEGKSDGWTLIYCKGPEGEQLEFVQALGPVKHTFDAARKARNKEKSVTPATAAVPGFRRIVTGHDQEGRAVIQSDGPPTRVQQIAGPGGPAFIEVWNTRQTPAVIDRHSGEPDEAGLVLGPPKGGTRIRVIDFPPESDAIRKLTAAEAAGKFAEMGDAGAARSAQGSPHPLMHRTQTLDYGIVLSGELTLVTDCDETVVRAGDIVI